MVERVVFDTNVQVSGLLWHGKAYQCLLLARGGIVQAVYCQPMLAELSQKLRRKFKFSENRIQSVLADIKRYAKKVEIRGDSHIVMADPDDDKFVECALTAKAGAIVSSDHHLLDLGQYEGIEILPPEHFIKKFIAESG